jgi:hypothetical protein
MIRGFSGNLGDLAVSIAMPAGDPAYQLQVDPRPTSEADGDERRTNRWYRQAKETKCGAKDGQESERLIVPMNRGNQPEGPWRGKGTPSHEPLSGNMAGTLRPTPCQRRTPARAGSDMR